MKKLYTMVLAAALIGTFTSCDDFLDYTPTAVVDEDKAFSEPDKMVNSAYAMLGNCWYSYPFNLWPYGDLSSDDCLKGGGGTGDTGYHDVEIWSTLTSTRGELDELWYRLYCAVSRCNRALVSLQQNGESTLGAEVTKQREAEVRFLRAHFYFKLLTMYRQILRGKFDFPSPEWDHVSDAAKDFISKLLIVDPEKRYTAKQVFFCFSVLFVGINATMDAI